MIRCCVVFFLFVLIIVPVFGQERMILVPQMVETPELIYQDHDDVCRNMIIFLEDGDVENAADSLKKMLIEAGLKIKKNDYYIVVVNYHSNKNIIGMFHGDKSFQDTRLYGLGSDSLFYVFVTDDSTMKSSVSAIVTRKDSNFSKNLGEFLSLFQLGGVLGVRPLALDKITAYISVRKFEVPKKFQKNCDITIVAMNESKNKELVRAIFDNSSKERWSYGVASAVTTVNDIDYEIDNGAISIRPKSKGDFATFGVINYHFKAVDTKSKTFSTSIHLMGGLRTSTTFEPILGLGGGLPIPYINLHLFAGYSFEFAQILKEGVRVCDIVTSNKDPFKLKVRGKPRFGIEIQFP